MFLGASLYRDLLFNCENVKNVDRSEKYDIVLQCIKMFNRR
jgi:hypothetical protein